MFLQIMIPLSKIYASHFYIPNQKILCETAFVTCIVKYVVFTFVSELLSVDALLFKNTCSSIRSVPCCCFLLGAFLTFYRVLTRTCSAIWRVVYEAPLNFWLSVQNPVELDGKSSSFPTKLLFHPHANSLRMKCLYVNPQIYMRTFYLISQLAEWP